MCMYFFRARVLFDYTPVIQLPCPKSVHKEVVCNTKVRKMFRRMFRRRLLSNWIVIVQSCIVAPSQLTSNKRKLQKWIIFGILLTAGEVELHFSYSNEAEKLIKAFNWEVSFSQKFEFSVQTDLKFKALYWK